MKDDQTYPPFALILSADGIALAYRAGDGWEGIGELDPASPDVTAGLTDLRKKAEARAPGRLRTRLVIPDDQIRFMSLELGLVGEDQRHARVRQALDGATPYQLDELVYDVAVDGAVTHVAAVALETLREAEGFATQAGFNPVSFGALPGAGSYPGEPFFGLVGDITLSASEDAIQSKSDKRPQPRDAKTGRRTRRMVLALAALLAVGLIGAYASGLMQQQSPQSDAELDGNAPTQSENADQSGSLVLPPVAAQDSAKAPTTLQPSPAQDPKPVARSIAASPPATAAPALVQPQQETSVALDRAGARPYAQAGASQTVPQAPITAEPPKAMTVTASSPAPSPAPLPKPVALIVGQAPDVVADPVPSDLTETAVLTLPSPDRFDPRDLFARPAPAARAASGATGTPVLSTVALPQPEIETTTEEAPERFSIVTLNTLDGVTVPRLRPRPPEPDLTLDQRTALAAAASQAPPLRPESNVPIFVVANSASAPKLRPAGLSVPRAAPQTASLAAAAIEADAPQVAATVSPRIPSSSSVQKEATTRNRLNLNRLSLMGVTGAPSSRKALVRLPSGRIRTLKVGDRIDGGQVVAIGQSELKYLKSGQNLTLKMPRG